MEPRVPPDGRMLLTGQPGRLRIVHHRKLQAEPVQGLPTIEACGRVVERWFPKLYPVT